MRQESPRGVGAVLIVDDDPTDRGEMAAVLSQAGFATREVATARDALEAVSRDPPRLVVLEVCLEDLSGYELCRELRDELGDGLPIVFVSADRAESHDRVAGFLVGGDDFLVKPVALDEFVARVRRLLERVEGRTVPGSGLTARELEVLTLVAEGLARDEIARRLFISPKTVGTHVEHIFKKLGVHTRAQAVSLAYEHGLLPAGSSGAHRG